METICVNLFGGPGSGKSSTSAGIFHLLKKQHINCELITEYAKDKVWLNDQATLSVQPYVSAKQLIATEKLNNKVDVMITDSPLLLGTIYADSWGTDNFLKCLHEWHNRYNNLNIFLKRNEEHFSRNGRNHDLEESIKIDEKIKNILQKYIFYLVLHDLSFSHHLTGFLQVLHID